MDLNKLWQAQQVPAFDIEEFRKLAKKYKKGRKWKFIWTNLLLGLTFVFIVCIAYFIKPEFKSTYVGLGLILSSIFLFLLVHSGILKLYLSLDHDSKSYVEKLREVQKREEFLSTQVLEAYTVLLGLGIALYMWEYAVKLGLLGGGIAYGITIIWIIINWVWLRPMQLKKEREKRAEVLEKAEKLQEQWK
ncbi:hypothetical protein [Leadbetterella byssophila]|uniref:hypothetical protein n=1 Tax=Leadbetterella byssophila TaxID=316068 RepID=UPI0039A11947